MASTNRKRKIGITLIVIIVILQFIPSKISVSPTSSESNIINAPSMTPEVKVIMVENCFDCHSNTIRKPWYYRIRPITFWIDHHIHEAREHINFDDWFLMDRKDQRHDLDECLEELEEGEMPLKSYEITHPGLSKKDRQTLMNWMRVEMDG
jgi:hypothetical protein